jgi:hypothetical protein
LLKVKMILRIQLAGFGVNISLDLRLINPVD